MNEQGLKVQGLKVAHINVNGLLNKIHEIKILLHSVKLDILAISKTHLHVDIKNEQIMVDGYQIARKDRPFADNSWGGCLIYFADSLNCFERENIKNNTNFESTWIDVTFASHKVIVGVAYKRPSDGEFYDRFQELLEPLCLSRNNILILGDLKADFLFEKGTRKDMTQGKRLLKILNLLKLKNVINKPTRITETSKTIIDLIIISDTSNISTAGCFDSGISDHHVVFAVLNLFRIRKKPIIKQAKNYKNVNLDAVKNDFEIPPWQICSVFEDLDDAVWAREYLFKSIVDTHITTRQAKVRSDSLPWIILPYVSRLI